MFFLQCFCCFNWYSELGQQQFIITTMIANIFRANNPSKRMPITSVQAAAAAAAAGPAKEMCAVSAALRPENQPSAAFYYLISHAVPRPRKRSLIRLLSVSLSVCVFWFSRTWPWRLGQLAEWLTENYAVCVARIETWNGADNDNGFSGSGSS